MFLSKCVDIIDCGRGARMLTCSCHMRQIVVQGLPWAYTSEELSGLFDEYKPASAEVVFGRDGRSRVRSQPVADFLEALAEASSDRLWTWLFLSTGHKPPLLRWQAELHC